MSFGNGGSGPRTERLRRDGLHCMAQPARREASGLFADVRCAALWGAVRSWPCGGAPFAPGESVCAVDCLGELTLSQVS